ncbi:expressed protein [Chlorella variabilis]|uniref:Expressed protein n=1 Tax=Chlorella variabilis TaxID=554065 RepID=E1Z3H7_CHLVA|nr:expressed protein [Chlorella variabilis]EFN60161.1 expressed protein [Chlorella variabilis]|eukprot:XP_005852263.1 expressed protein [Chlorella variabilis]
MQAGASLALSAGLAGGQQGRAASAAAGLATTGAAELLQRPAGRPAVCCRAVVRRVEAFAQGYSPGYGSRGFDGTYERVLRYPDGKERRIRYPLPPPAEEVKEEDVTDGCWATDCWIPREQHWGGPPRGASAGATATAVVASAAASPPAQHPADFLPQQPPAQPERAQVPSSPMELLRYLNSPEHKQSQEQLWQKVRGSYEVLCEVPWVAPRPLYLLAMQQTAAAAAAAAEPSPGLTYSLRTRVARADTEDELSRVLRRRAADGSPLIRCSEMRDGVVAFEDEADAERYGQLLEAEGLAEVSMARCDSHDLFRSVQDVRGVVVLLRAGGAFLPQPHQLAASLRSTPGGGAGGGGGGEPLFD